MVQWNELVVPLEVKAGTRGGMRSMKLFMAERNSPVGIRLSHENVSRYGSVLSLPVYLASLLPQTLAITPV